MTVTTPLLDEDVRAIVDQVWYSLLETETAFGPVGAEPADSEVRTATVTISGPVPMLVAVETDLGSATSMTSRLLDVDAPSADDVADALGELVNVLGGNLKSLLPGPSTLSLPVTTTGRVTPSSRAQESACVVAAWSGHAVTLTTHLLLTPLGDDLP